jgi:hypothetical protein
MKRGNPLSDEAPFLTNQVVQTFNPFIIKPLTGELHAIKQLTLAQVWFSHVSPSIRISHP